MTTARIAFLFIPGDHVKIIHLGLGYRGRILECIYGSFDQIKYAVEYADNNGEIRSHQFYGDELTSVL